MPEDVIKNNTCKNCVGFSPFDKYCSEYKKVVKPEDTCSHFEDNTEKMKENLKEAYLNIKDMLRRYCDLDELDYPIIATWIIGTYFHDQFESYPYLFLNAMKGSGKTRTLKLITDLSKDGEMILSPTEAVLFRTKSTLGIDEFEGLTKKGYENLRELLNACYKRGNKVKRMKQRKTPEGVEQVVEEFEVYRPLVMANINGMEDVLGDRCITVTLERSNNPNITQLVEIWKHEKMFKETVKLLNQCSLCSSVVFLRVYEKWNNYITNNYTIYTIHTNNTNNTNYTHLFEKVKFMDITGRELELIMPLLLISSEIAPEIMEENYTSLQNYTKSRKEEQFNESLDISLIDWVSQEPSEEWQSLTDIVRKFKQFLNTTDEDVNNKWMGRALKRLKLRLDTRRRAGGIQVRLNIKKAVEKIRMFK